VSGTFLATGFEPFRQYRVNSSWAALERLRDVWPARVRALCLPVDHVAAHRELRRALVELRPAAVLCTGLAVGSGFRVERRARRPAELASEVGEVGDDPLEGAWPWSEMQLALERAGVEAADSDDAGRYVCESTYWSLLSHRRGAGWPQFAAFLHVPQLSELYPVERIARAVQGVIEARLAETRESAEDHG
jgi:pyroglutamyl-peptidase